MVYITNKQHESVFYDLHQPPLTEMLSIPRSTKLVQGVSCLMISFLIEKELPASSRTCTSTHLMKLLTALSSYCYHHLTECFSL